MLEKFKGKKCYTRNGLLVYGSLFPVILMQLACLYFGVINKNIEVVLASEYVGLLGIGVIIFNLLVMLMPVDWLGLTYRKVIPTFWALPFENGVISR